MTEDPIRLHAEKERSREEVLFWRPTSPVLWNTEEHSHSKGQLFSLQSGLGILKTTAGIWMLPPGRCAWIPPGRPIPCAPVDTLLDGRSTCVRLCCDSLPIEPAILSL